MKQIKGLKMVFMNERSNETQQSYLITNGTNSTVAKKVAEHFKTYKLVLTECPPYLLSIPTNGCSDLKRKEVFYANL